MLRPATDMIVSSIKIICRSINYLSGHVLLHFFAGFKLKVAPRAKVVFIKVDALGDFILWINCAEVLSQNYSTYEKVLICSSQVKDLALSLKLFDTVIAIDHVRYVANPLYRYSIYKILRSHAFDVLIQCNFSRSLWIHDDLSYVARSKHKVSPKGDLLNSNAWLHAVGLNVYTEIVPNNDQYMNQIEQNYHFIQHLGFTIQWSKPSIPIRCITHSIDLSSPYFIVFMGASVAYRRWPSDKFAELATYISSQTGWIPVLCGIHNEKCLGDDFKDIYNGDFIDLIGMTSLSEFFGLASDAELLIGNDTSSVHIASALNTPSIAMVGGGHHAHFLPYPGSLAGTNLPYVVDFQMECFGCNWKCPYVKSPEIVVPCISSITVDSAKMAFNKLYPSL